MTSKLPEALTDARLAYV